MPKYELPEMFQKIAQQNFPDAKTADKSAKPTDGKTADAVLDPQTAAQLEQANAAISSLAREYPNWAMRDIKNMRKLLGDAKSVSGDERTRILHKELFTVAHNAKGQGATFNYPLITDIGDHLCRYIERIPNFNSSHLANIKKHIDAMEMVLSRQLMGNKHELGKKLLEEIRQIQ